MGKRRVVYLSRDQNQVDGLILGNILPSYIGVSKKKTPLKQIGIMECQPARCLVSNIFYFHHYLGKMNPFQMG